MLFFLYLSVVENSVRGLVKDLVVRQYDPTTFDRCLDSSKACENLLLNYLKVSYYYKPPAVEPLAIELGYQPEVFIYPDIIFL